MVEFKNRDGDIYTFRINESGNIDWLGDFKYLSRFGYLNSPDSITMVDPSGGPYMEVGQDMGFFTEEWEGKKISGFKWKDLGYYEIIVS